MAKKNSRSSSKKDSKLNQILLLIAATSSFLGLFTPFALEIYKDSQIAQRRMGDEEIKARLDLIHIVGQLQTTIGDVIRAHNSPHLKVSESWQSYYLKVSRKRRIST